MQCGTTVEHGKQGELCLGEEQTRDNVIELAEDEEGDELATAQYC